MPARVTTVDRPHIEREARADVLLALRVLETENPVDHTGVLAAVEQVEPDSHDVREQTPP